MGKYVCLFSFVFLIVSCNADKNQIVGIWTKSEADDGIQMYNIICTPSGVYGTYMSDLSSKKSYVFTVGAWGAFKGKPI